MKNIKLLFLVLIISVLSSCSTKSHKERREEMLQKEGKEISNETVESSSVKNEINDPNYKEGVAFLAENGKKENIFTTESGLQYEVLRMGTGAKPSANDKVKVHYEGTLINGSIFDSSYKRGEAISFPLNGVIKGWTEGLQLMPVGSKFKLYIPYDLAYGERGSMPNIPPYSALIFTVELIEIEEAPFDSNAALNMLANKLNNPNLTFYELEDTQINGEEAFYFSTMKKENGKNNLDGMYCVTKKKKEIYRMHLNDAGYDKIQ